MTNDIDRTSPHYKGDFGSIYEVNKKFPTGGVAGDFVVIEGWAHYWNEDRASWCVNAERDSYWDELITNIIEKFKLVRGATYMGVASLDTVPAKVIGAKMYYFATVAGTYKNFGDLVVPQGINVLYSENGSSWVNTTLLEVAQELGVSTKKVVSQKALNDALNLKANQGSVNEALAKKADKETVNTELAKKFDKKSVVQESGEAEDKVMSQKAVSVKLSDLLGKVSIKDEEGNVQDTPFRVIENEEFIYAVIDSEDRYIFGIYRDSGKPYFPLNEMYHVEQNEEFFALWLDAADHVLLGIRRDGQIIGEIHAVNALKQVVSALREKIDTIDTSLKELLDIFSLQDNTEHLAMETDAEGRILSSTNPDGSHYIHNAKSETIPEEFSHIEDPEGRTEIIMDTEEKVLGYRDSNGILNEKIGINSSRYFLNGKEKDWAERGDIHFSDINDAISHNTTNLLVTSEISKTFNDGKTTFSPPNAGYELSNRIECKAGDYFTRTGTATGLIVVTDKNDTNGMRLLNSDGSTLGSTFQIPNSLDWVRYIRMAVNKEEAIKGNIAICKGKYAFTGENKGDFYTIDSIRIQEKNLPNDVRYLKTSDGKYWELYIDETDLSVKAKEVDPSVIKDLPLDFPIFEIKGDFSEFGQRILFYCGKYMIVRNNNGVVAYKNSQNPGYSEFRRETAPNGDFRYVGISSKGNKFILEIFDDDFKIVNSYTGMCDPHDFVYYNDNHIAILEGKSVNVNIPNGNSVLSSNIYCSRIRELRFNGTSWSEIGSFNVEAYPQLLTDCCGITEGKTYEPHHNTLFVDYDGNYIINLRNCNSFVKIKRVEVNENEIIIGSKRHDYDEAIIGRVGGIYNSGYMDSKRIIPEGFSFDDTPVSLNSRSNDEQPLWMFYHQHDVAYWGKKKIDSKEYPTYTLFDNNAWTGNGSDNLYDDINQRNNYKNNPTANNTSSYNGGYSSDTYDSHTISRCVQISVDWENRLIKDFKVYQIKKRYSSTRGSAQMLDEGVILFNWADQNRCGLYDFNDPTTNVNGKLYENGKELFSCYTNILGTYRLHLY